MTSHNKFGSYFGGDKEPIAGLGPRHTTGLTQRGDVDGFKVMDDTKMRSGTLLTLEMTCCFTLWGQMSVEQGPYLGYGGGSGV